MAMPTREALWKRVEGETLLLAKAPIIEAVIDIDCDMPPGLDLKVLESPARERFQDQYPGLRTQFIQEHRIQVAPDVSVSPEMSVRQAIQAFQFVSQDEKQLVQLRTAGFSFNRLAPYKSLNDYIPEIQRTWK